jgi:RecA-family ATPase
LHPFLGTTCEPKTVLFVDAENPAKIMVKTMGRMRDAAAYKKSPVDPNRLWIRRRPEGLNLADPAERLWLKREAQTVNADLLCIGPAYKLYFGGKGEREEDLARQVTVALDLVRDAAGCAVILEHHSPHQSSNDRARNVRPIGSSLWLRWPEFGLGIRLAEEDGAYERRLMDVVAWRGARDERDWPKQLVATTNPSAMPWTDGIYA